MFCWDRVWIRSTFLQKWDLRIVFICNILIKFINLSRILFSIELLDIISSQRYWICCTENWLECCFDSWSITIHIYTNWWCSASSPTKFYLFFVYFFMLICACSKIVMFYIIFMIKKFLDLWNMLWSLCILISKIENIIFASGQRAICSFLTT